MRRAAPEREKTVQPPEGFFGGAMITWMVCGQLMKLGILIEALISIARLSCYMYIKNIPIGFFGCQFCDNLHILYAPLTDFTNGVV